MRKSLEILQAGTLELSQLVQQALETNPVLEDITETISLDEDGPDPEEADSLDYMNQTDDDWRDRTILEGKSSPWTSEDEERRLLDFVNTSDQPGLASAAGAPLNRHGEPRQST